MTDWYKRIFAKGWSLGLCGAPCGATAAGPPQFARRAMAEHNRRHRPGGMVLTDYGMRTLSRT